jgi:hypothetical protein
MISPLRMLALDSDVCPTPVTRTVAPLNTYTFLKSVLYTLLLWNAPHTRTDSPEAEH